MKKKDKTACNHKNAYFFHENAPMFCPDCNEYIDGGTVVETKMKTAKEECDYIIENVLMQKEADIILSRIQQLEQQSEKLFHVTQSQAAEIDLLTNMNDELIQQIKVLELGYKVILDDIDFGYDIEMIKNKIRNGNYNNAI